MTCQAALPNIVLTIVAIVGFSLNAQADEMEIQLTIGPGYSSLPDLGEGMDGLGGGAELRFGLSPFWSLTAGGFYGHHFEQIIPSPNEGDDEEEEEPVTLTETDVIPLWFGTRFDLDVFVIVPYLGLAPELLLTSGELPDERGELEIGLRYTMGFDYRPTRNWSLGFEVNYHAYIDQPLTYPVLITTFFRGSFHYDFNSL